MVRYKACLLGLFVAGIVLRVAVFFHAAPFNPDQHWQLIEWIIRHRALPASHELGQSFHPPLYHVLMVPLAIIARGGFGLVHLASLALSCVNLWLIYRLVQRQSLFPSGATGVLALAFAAFLPQYVMYGHFISNDTLTILLGTLLSAAVYSYVEAKQESSRRWLITVAVLCGLGLLTKGTFLLTGAALSILVLLVECHRQGSERITARRVATFCAIWLALGCYKYVENLVHFGRPIVHNLDDDPEWARPQKGVFKGIRTIVDANPSPLIRMPLLNYLEMKESYPQLLFATFWYPHIPDSSFRGNVQGYMWVGQGIYVAAIVPTLLFVIGFVHALIESFRWFAAPGFTAPRRLILLASLLLLISNAIVVIGAGVRYDVWSCFQSRLLFQSMVPILILFAHGTAIVTAHRLLRPATYALCACAVAGCIVYFAVEIALVHGLLERGPDFHF